MRPLLIVLLIFSFVNTCIYAHGEDYALKAWQSKLAGKWKEARKYAALSQDTALTKLISYEYYLTPQNHASFDEIVDFIEQNKDWPKIDELKIAAEIALNDRTRLNYVKILSWFKKNPPTTPNGYKYYLKSFGSKINNYSDLVQEAWIKCIFNSEEKKEFLKNYGQYLKYNSHLKKFDRLIWSKQILKAKKQLKFLKKADIKVANVKIALAENNNKAENLYIALPKTTKEESLLLYQYVLYKSREDKISPKIAKLALNAPKDSAREQEWSRLKNIVARHLIEDKHYKLAYSVAKSYYCKDSGTISKLEFLCGFIALRYLNDSKLALDHFIKFKKHATISSSIAKSNYWVARCYKAQNKKELATQYFQNASKLNFTFYGMLALDELKQKTLLYKENTTPTKNYSDNLFKALKILIKFETIHEKNSELQNFAMHMIRNSTDKSRIASIIKLLIATKKDHIVIESARVASSRGVFLLDCAFPKPPAIKSSINHLWVYAIIRQESSFHSHANNLEGRQDGVMQVIPETAAKISALLGIENEKHQMRDNINHSIKIGSAYLKLLADYYKGSYLLATPSYNAGEHRIDSWIKRFGDPRQFTSLYKIIDWMEQVPFEATRQYIQNVLQNIQIYNYKLNNNKLVLPSYLLGKIPIDNIKILSAPNLQKLKK
ncbi:MAG: lytic transglycosylase domain-containing protein [Rickettsiaceae bacterium]|nr:lytic transglycosylase domain-containing protein [Rickettsiaceae bacterium]